MGGVAKLSARVLIALTGPAGAGKSTAAESLETAHGFARIRFADPLKNMMRSLYRDAGLDEAQIERRIEGDLKEVPCDILCGRTPRHAMQTLGTEWGRDHIHPSFWVMLWHRRAAPHKRVVAEDCRFENEAKTIHNSGGTIIQIQRQAALSKTSTHASESGGLPVDIILSNDGDKQSLWQRLHIVVQQMIGGR
jgi:hypothetical protein